MHDMTLAFWILLASLQSVASDIISGPGATTDQLLVLERSIPLENVAGRIDHMAIDLEGKRLFVAELGNDSVDVIDVEAGKVVARIGGLNEPQGIAHLADRKLVLVANGGDGSVRFFRAGDLSHWVPYASATTRTTSGWIVKAAMFLSDTAVDWLSSIP